jgi:hypothetical protein
MQFAKPDNSTENESWIEDYLEWIQQQKFLEQGKKVFVIGFSFGESAILPKGLRPLSTALIELLSRFRPQKNPPNKKKFDHPMIFFSYIARTYQADEKNLDDIGEKYFDEQITKFKSTEMLLKSMAVEITILSSNINKKYQLINLSFIFVAASLALMSVVIVLSNYAHYFT